MSNIRDLQKLKNTRFVQPLNHTPSRAINPENSHFNYEPLSMQIGHTKTTKNTQYGKDSLRPAASKIMHKRGASFGTADAVDRNTHHFLQNPRLSMYLCPHLATISP